MTILDPLQTQTINFVVYNGHILTYSILEQRTSQRSSNIIMTFGKYLRILAALCASASTAVATGVIVPLYIFPGSAPSCTAWAPLISA